MPLAGLSTKASSRSSCFRSRSAIKHLKSQVDSMARWREIRLILYRYPHGLRGLNLAADCTAHDIWESISSIGGHPGDELIGSNQDQCRLVKRASLRADVTDHTQRCAARFGRLLHGGDRRFGRPEVYQRETRSQLFENVAAG
jgi:hypothetical protein